jgi:hypothetical protein
MPIGEREIECARRLFEEGWFSDDPYAPTRFMTDDAVMRDIAGHPEALVGHDEIAEFWAPIAGRLRLPIEELFVSEDGIVVLWFAYVRFETAPDAPWHCGEGCSRLEFRHGLVSLEIDYWHGPQGTCDDWEVHFAARQALSRRERGQHSGAWSPQ